MPEPMQGHSPDLMPRRSTPLARTFLALTGSQVSGRIIRFVYLLVIARYLGPEGTAVYLYGLAVSLSLGVLASFGQGVLLATRMGRGTTARRVLVRHSLTLRLLFTTLALAAGGLVLLLQGAEPEMRIVLAVFLAAMIVRSLADWMREWSIAMEDASWIPRFEVAFRGLEAVAGSLLLLQGAGALAISIVYLCGRALEAVAAARLMQRHHGLPFRLGTDRRLLRLIVAVSLILATGAGCLTLFTQVGIIALKQLAPDLADLAYFGVAMQFMMTLMVLPTVLAVAMLPAVGRVRRTSEREGLAGLSLLIRLALLIGAAVAVFVDAYAPWFVGLVLGADFKAAGHLLADLVWILGPYAATVLACQSLNGLGAHRQAALAALTLVVVLLAVMTISIPAWGLAGATLSVWLAALSACALAFAALRPFVAPSERRFWLLSLVLTAGLFLILKADFVPAPWLAPPLFLGAVALSWRVKLLRRTEVAFLLQRFGIDHMMRRDDPRRV